MSLAAISRSTKFFQPCQFRATPYENMAEYSTLQDLGFWSKEKEITYTQFTKALTQCPNLLDLGDNFEQTVIDLVVLTDSQNLLKRIVQISNKNILEIGTSFRGRTPLFAAVYCKKYSTIKQLIELGANVNASSSYILDSSYIMTVLEYYVLKLTKPKEHEIDQAVVKPAAKLLLGHCAYIKNSSKRIDWMRNYLVELCQEFSDDIQDLCETAQTIQSALGQNLHEIIIDYAIEINQDPAYDYIKRHNHNYNQPTWFKPPPLCPSSCLIA